jgi:NAD kinase
MDYEKIVLVTRKTRLEGLIERFNTRAQARFYIEHSGGDFNVYEREHDTYHAALSALPASLEPLLNVQTIERAYLPAFLFAETDMVVTIGIDGLVANTAKYLSSQPLIAVNPDPAHIDGVLLPFTVREAAAAVRRVLKGQHNARAVTMAEARLNDGQRLLAFNDLFIGARTHVSARYTIHIGDRWEAQSSSGVIVSTGIGATGWLSSLFNMANGLWAAFGQPASALQAPALSPEADWLAFVVREPFISKTSQAGIVGGVIERDSPLRIEAHMPEGGVIFSDGVESDFLAFNTGSAATICLADRRASLVIK